MPDSLVIREGQSIDLVKVNGMSIEAEKIAAVIVISDDVEERMAVDSLSRIKSFQRKCEEQRKEYVQPFNEIVARINAAFRPIGDSLTKAEGVIKGKLKEYAFQKQSLFQEEEARRLAEHRKKVQEEMAKSKEEGREANIIVPAPSVLPAAPTTHGETGRATAKKFWNYEVVDIAALYAARPDLVKLEVKRRETLVAVAKDQAIPGLKIYEDLEIAAR
jgi:hypothetical protein